MNRKKFTHITHIFLALILIGSVNLLAKPGNVECIAPADPGGGWDFTCRVPAAKIMSDLDLIEGQIKVTNMSGGGGGIAYSHVVNRRSDDENLIVAGSMATAARLGQNVYKGLTIDDVRWAGALGADYGVIVVHKNSRFKDLKSFMDSLARNPRRTPIVGGSAAGGWDHLKVLILASKHGIEDLKAINYISFNSGGNALLEIISRRADAFTGDISEVLSYYKKGDVRILAILAPNRIDQVPDVKTAIEQGFDFVGANWRGFYVPKNISDGRYKEWVDIIKTVANSSEWKTLREKNALAEFSSFGEDFENFVKSQVAEVARISTELGFISQ